MMTDSDTEIDSPTDTDPAADENTSTGLDFQREQALVHVVSRVEFNTAGKDVEADLEEAQTRIINWIAGKITTDLPEEAWQGESFRLPMGAAGLIEGFALYDQGYWALRSVLPDAMLPTRRWVTEVMVAIREDHLRVGVTLISKTEGREDFPPRLLPAFIPRIIRALPCRVGDGDEPLSCDPWIVDSDAEVERLVEALTDPSRQQEIIVLSTAQGSEDPRDTITPADRLQFRLSGVARVVVLTSQASFGLTARIGKEYSLFRQAVRSYRPGFDPLRSRPHDHPLALPQRINTWQGGPDAFFTLLCDHAIKAGLMNCDEHSQLPPFSQLQHASRQPIRSEEPDTWTPPPEPDDVVAIRDSAEAEAPAEAASSPAEAPTAEPTPTPVKVPKAATAAPIAPPAPDIEAELAKLETQHAKEVLVLTRERNSAMEALSEAQSQIETLEARITVLEDMLKAGGAHNYTDIPESFAELESWAERHLKGRIVLHSRAIRAAKKSTFEDVPLAYRALLILADYYLPMKFDGGFELKVAYEEALRQEGLIEEGTFAGNGTGEHGDAYTITWEGRKFKVDRHLKGSNSRDPRYGFRLYFVWDEETGQIIVASLPSHLKTKAT